MDEHISKLNGSNGFPDEHPRRRRRVTQLGIDRPQLEDLLAHLREALLHQPCDGTLRMCVEWAELRDIDIHILRRILERFGGYCDDEVLYNINPHHIFR